jgi:hypothetical protein
VRGTPLANLLKNALSPVSRRAECVFVLSTGRCGTTTLRSLINLSAKIHARHEPYPYFLPETWKAYQEQPQSPAEAGRLMRRFTEARTRPLLNSTIRNILYVECSNRMTYIAPLLAAHFPKSRFIHMFRNPAAVVRSGMRRRFYDPEVSDRTEWDTYRTVPNSNDPYRDQWDDMTPFEKCCWYWHAINEFSMRFLQSLDSSRCYAMRAEALFDNNGTAISGLFDWLGRELPPAAAIQTALAASTNAQVIGDFPRWRNWSNVQRDTLWRIAGSTIDELGYTESLSL